MWLHLVCGLIKLNCRRAWDQLIEIIVSVSQRFAIDCMYISSIPHDVRTINRRLKLEASLEKYVSCPKCFSLYDIETAPADCGCQASSKIQPCGVELFKSNQILGSLKAPIFIEPQSKRQTQSHGLL
ncbi:hypothetical protein O181_120741 [Austropuccinia psidii MF-1]|uniref:Uncharacterized protein n=1 Tax=Austropuccinia psidii MF-1 TaxID=1389203 RepID=A0A9Q3KI85_9BASI|nr:hypothetical protein [Austropuccinia psidii MF-1]